MTDAGYRKLIPWLIGAWFLFALVASAVHLFYTGPDGPPVALGLAALVPVAAVWIWAAASRSFRQFLLGLNPHSLTLIHSWRIVGYAFLVLYTYAILPGVFALSAGWGDIAIGATAPFVAASLVRFDRRKSFILWQALGITDLVMALTLAASARWISPHAAATTPMTLLPLSLIPTFAVPLLLILHGICIAQARRWNASSHADARVATSWIEGQQPL